MQNRKACIRLGLILIFAAFSSSLDAQNVKINEILYDAIGSDTGKEWIELYNADTISINLKDYKIEKAGESFSTCFTFPADTLEPGEFLLIGEEEVENADMTTTLGFYNSVNRTDGVRIISADGDTIDTVLYGEPNNNDLPGDANQPGIYFAPDTDPGNSLIRFPDGYDTDNCENDFFECITTTPGLPNCNISLDSLTFVPSHPDTTDNVSVTFFIKNLAPATLYAGICNYKILIDDNLLIEGAVEDTIPANDTLAYTVHLGIFNPGIYNLKVNVFPHDFISDSNNVIFTSFLVGEAPIIINEIMFYPGEESGGIEWVEVYNRSDSTLSLLNWHIRDANPSWRPIISDKELSPGSYGVIVDEGDSLEVLSEYYGGDITFFQSDRFPGLNNDEDEVLLGNSFCTVIDSVFYTVKEPDCPQNYSIERIIPFEDLPDNWGVSKDSLGATPGRMNSLTPRDYDLAAVSLTYTRSGGRLHLLGVCQNTGFNDIADAEFFLFYDANFNYVMEENEILDSGFFSLPVDDSCEYTAEWTIPTEGYYQFGFKIDAELDMQQGNNIIFATYNSPESFPVTINEIQFKPKSDEPEWLELYHNFPYPLSIKGWKLSDPGDTISFSQTNINCQPAAYIVVVPDTADIDYLKVKYSLTSELPLHFLVELPNLNDTEDILVIQDRFGTVLDSIHYYADWSEERDGHALERVNPDIPTNNPDNWEYSVHPKGATPGRQNSIYIETLNPEISLSISPNPVSLRKDHAVILEYNLPEVISKVNIRIFDVRGRLIRWLSDQEFCAAQGEIIWDCKDDKGDVVPIGIYIVYMEAVGRQTRKVFRETATMVVGEK